MSREEDYLRNAKDAQEWADRATTTEDREGWLRVAQGWLNLFTRWTAHCTELSKARSPNGGSDRDA